MTQKSKENFSFEQALERLEEITTILESGKLTLDESLAIFEEGVMLTHLCQKKLDKAQQKISIVLKNEDGTYREHSVDADQI